VLDEAHWYGVSMHMNVCIFALSHVLLELTNSIFHSLKWFIDYYMEDGLLRDIFTHKTTTKEHWDMLMMPTVYTRAELDYDLVVGADTVVEDAYDPHCATVTEGCAPVAVISAENLRDYSRGKAETALIGNVLKRNSKMGDYVIEDETWDCSKFFRPVLDLDLNSALFQYF